jgi:hypothetical protein
MTEIDPEMNPGRYRVYFVLNLKPPLYQPIEPFLIKVEE